MSDAHHAAEAVDARTLVAVSACAFGIVAPAAYVVQRLFERARGNFTDPSLVITEPHTSFYWRCVTAGWWGGLAAILVWGLLRGAASRNAGLALKIARPMRRGALPLLFLLALLMAWLP